MLISAKRSFEVLQANSTTPEMLEPALNKDATGKISIFKPLCCWTVMPVSARSTCLGGPAGMTLSRFNVQGIECKVVERREKHQTE